MVSHMLPTANYYFSPNDIAIIVIALRVVFVGLWSGRRCMREVDVSTLCTVDEYTVIFSSFRHMWLVWNECGHIMLALYLCPCAPLCTTEYYPANHATELQGTVYCIAATTQHYGALWTSGRWLWWPNNRGLYNQATSTTYTISDGGVLWVFPDELLSIIALRRFFKSTFSVIGPTAAGKSTVRSFLIKFNSFFMTCAAYHYRPRRPNYWPWIAVIYSHYPSCQGYPSHRRQTSGPRWHPQSRWHRQIGHWDSGHDRRMAFKVWVYSNERLVL